MNAVTPASSVIEPPIRIVVVEDMDNLREQVVAFLDRPEWPTRGARNGIELDTHLREEPADIVVLDVGLPGESGMTIAERLRASQPSLGIVMLTARIFPSDRAQGYVCGADIYLGKPVNPSELEAALQSLSRRLRAASRRRNATLILARSALLSADGHEIALSDLECRLLHELARAPQNRLSHEELAYLMRQVRDTDVSRNHLAVIVSRLRDRTQRHAELGELVGAVRGFGYRLACEITIAH